MKHRRRSKFDVTIRAVMVVVLLAVAGAILSVAVAWGCVLWSPLKTKTMLQSLPADHRFAASISRFRKFDHFGAIVQEGFGWRHHYIWGVHRNYSASSPYNKNWLEQIHAGWPFLCLQGERWTIQEQMTFGRVVRAPGVPRRQNYISVLPYEPAWPGLLLNAAIYASALGGVWLMIAGVKRMRRPRAGCCIKCGYDLRGGSGSGDARCPECGTPTKTPAFRRRE